MSIANKSRANTAAARRSGFDDPVYDTSNSSVGPDALRFDPNRNIIWREEMITTTSRGLAQAGPAFEGVSFRSKIGARRSAWLESPGVVRAAILQAKWTGDTDVDDRGARVLRARRGRAGRARSWASRRSSTRRTSARCRRPSTTGGPSRCRTGPTVQRMQALARETGMVLVVPVFEIESSGNYYNTAAVIDADGSVLGKYRKHHIPQVKGFWEKYYFRPGNLGWPVFDTAVGKVGVYICYDRHFPEGWRALGLAGAQIVFNPSATSRSLSSYLWKLEQPAAAVANEYFMAAINRVGRRGVRRQRLLRHQLLRRPARAVRRRAGVGQRRGAGRPRPGPRHDRRGAPAVGVLPGPPPGRLRAAGAAMSGGGTAERPARPHPGGAAVLAGPLLRRADRDRARRGPPRLGRRRQPLPGLLRRHPHHDDRARAARGDQGRRRAGRADHPQLHAVPEPADGGAGRADRRRSPPSRTPRSS